MRKDSCYIYLGALRDVRHLKCIELNFRFNLDDSKNAPTDEKISAEE